MSINIDCWTIVFLKTDLKKPFFLISKNCNQAYKNSVHIFLKQFDIIRYKIFNRPINLKLHFEDYFGWGLVVQTKHRTRFFEEKKIVSGCPLWVEKNMLVFIINKTLKVKYLHKETVDYFYFPLEDNSMISYLFKSEL